MKSYAFLFWGYLAVWIGISVYLGILGRRISRLAKRLRDLESRRDGPRPT